MNIIHIVENLDKGAVENWLVRTIIESKKNNPYYTWTLFCILGKPGQLDEKAKEAGIKIIYSPYTVSQKKLFLKYLKQILLKGNYDIIHSHHDYLSGFYLLSTINIKFKKRILHIHNTDRIIPVRNRITQILLRIPLKFLALLHSDLVIGISKDTLNEFIGKNIFRKSTKVLYYGLDLNNFSKKPNNLKKKLGLPVNNKIMLYVGRLNYLKNPFFVINILNEISKIRDDVNAVFVGEGNDNLLLENAIRLGVEDKIKIIQWSDNVPSFMHMADVFVFPRLEYPKEGLGLVIIESQTAGLPIFTTNGIVSDTHIIPELINILPLNKNEIEWAYQINILFNNKNKISREEAYKQMKKSQFELSFSTNELINIYNN